MYPQSRRAGAIASAAVMAAALITGCTGEASDSEAEPVTIGWLVPETGPLAAIGADMRNAFELYLDIHGDSLSHHPIETVVADEGTSPKAAIQSIGTLLDEKPAAIAGIATAAAYDAVVPTIQDAKVPFIGTGERPAVVPVAPDGVWQVSWTTREPAEAIAEYLSAQLTGSVFVIGSNDLSGREQSKSFVDTFTESLGSLANIDGAPALVGSGDLAAQLENASLSGASAIYAAFSTERAVDFIRQFDQSSAADIPLYTGFTTEQPLLEEHGKKAADVYSAANYYATIDNEANRDFVAQWAKRYQGMPSAYALAAWDTAIVLEHALDQIPAGEEVTPERLSAAIAQVGEINSPRGPWRFTDTTHSPVQRWYLRQVTREGPTLVNTVVSQLATLGA